MLTELNQLKQTLKDIYAKQGWDQYVPFVDSNFLLEEFGEISELLLLYIGVKNIEPSVKVKLTEELGDLLGALLAIANRYDLNIDGIENPRYHNQTRIYMITSQHLGLIAREIRRQEIGRHIHDEDEKGLDTKTHFQEIWTKTLNVLLSLFLNLDIETKEIIKIHTDKMTTNY